MKTPFGIEVGKKYCIYHVSKNTLEIATIMSEFKVLRAEKRGNDITLTCEHVRQAKYKPESFTIKTNSLHDGYVLHPKLKNVGEEL